MIAENLPDGSQTLMIFYAYMLRIVLAAYRDFETRISLVEDKLPAIEMVRKAVCEKIDKKRCFLKYSRVE